jgi:hypothetical protein
MIQEVIVTTQNAEGNTHSAPMGVHIKGDQFIILPFRPSTTLSNILESKVAVINYIDDVRIFAGCLTGRRDWSLTKTENIKGAYLSSALAHRELELVTVEEDDTRPQLICKSIYTVNHSPFQGFNRAQYAVLEAAILVSRLKRLPIEKIEAEINYLKVGLDKTAGERELEAWGWLMQVIDRHKKELG